MDQNSANSAGEDVHEQLWLPIDDVRAQVERGLSGERPLIVVGPTGSGKSTRLPLWMAGALFGPVLVIEPRRVACRSLARFLAEGLGEAAGGQVGYTIRFEDVSSARTRVLFVTPGVALRRLRERSWPFAGVLVDEVHERGWEVDLAIASLMKRRAQAPFPLVLTSATLETAAVAERLGADVVCAEGRQHPVVVRHAGGAPSPARQDLELRVTGAVAEAARHDDGDILVFLPGKGEIEACLTALGHVAATHSLMLVPVHGALSTEQLTVAFGPASRRRVFLSTNVAETSITLPGVTTVVDSGLVRMRVHRAGRSALSLCPASLASMDQRTGRAGRVRPGRCVRLWDERYRPELSTQPEVERIDLDDVLLQAAACGVMPDGADERFWLLPPPTFAVERARAWLRGLGALTDAGELTERGRRLADLPVSADEGRLLVDVPEPLLDAVVGLVSILRTGARLLLPIEALGARAEEVQVAREELLASCTDEVTAQLVCLRRGDPQRHGLHREALAEARKVCAQLRGLWGGRGEPAPLPPRDALADYLLSRMPDAAFVLRDRAKKREGSGPDPWGNGQVELNVRPFFPIGGAKRGPAPDAGLVLDHAWLGSERGLGVRGVGGMLLPCTRAQLARAGLGEVEVGPPTVEKGRGTPIITASVRTVYAGVVLLEVERPLEGRALCEAVASLVLQGRLVRGQAERVLDAVHLWNLAADVADSPAPRIDDPALWLAHRLYTIGVRTSEDIALLDPADLSPDPTVHGVSDEELRALAKDLPRVWELHGARYVCRINPRRRQVILEPEGATARRTQEPDAFHLPRFRGYEVTYRKASRVVKLR